jgi:hypothetical protein
MSSRDDAQSHESPEGRVPENPRARPAETVDALEAQDSAEPDADEQAIAGDDVSENPDTDELEGLPGPSQDEPGESAG